MNLIIQKHFTSARRFSQRQIHDRILFHKNIFIQLYKLDMESINYCCNKARNFKRLNYPNIVEIVYIRSVVTHKFVIIFKPIEIMCEVHLGVE